MEKITDSRKGLLSLSVVSHGQMAWVLMLMADLQKHCRGSQLELIVTLNVDEPLVFDASDYFYPIKVLKNQKPKGFGANQNQAFKQAEGLYFCAINPDIRLESDPFPSLLADMNNPTVGVIAPLVIGPDGELEDSVRRFPTPWIIFSKLLGRHHSFDYLLICSDADLDWVGGMFMLFRREIFQQMSGFDERYFLYYEDVDLCGRLHLAGYRVAVCPQSRVIHHAQRSSHRSLRFLRWHVTSMLRFFTSSVYCQLKKHRQP